MVPWVNGQQSFFDWDDKSVDNSFCNTTRNTLFDGLRRSGKELPLIEKHEAAQFLKKSQTFSIFKFGFGRSFEVACVEEFCERDSDKKSNEEAIKCAEDKKDFINKHCDESDDYFFGNHPELVEHKDNIIKIRQQKYEMCNEHVKRRMQEVMGLRNKDGKEVKDDSDKDMWRTELKPDRLFRGWWHELQKAFLRVCLTDETDCARKCDYNNGVCQLLKVKGEWKYECECKAAYEPLWSNNDDPMKIRELCGEKKRDSPKGACNPLTDRGDYIDHTFLCKALNGTFGDCDHSNQRERDRRAIGSKFNRHEYIANTRKSYFPWVVELNYYHKDLNSPSKTGGTSSNSEISGHKCSGTLVAGKKNDFVITAAHCFCKYPDMTKWIVRIGSIDSSRRLNVKYNLTKLDVDGEEAFDTRIIDWDLGTYQNDGCGYVMGDTPSGKNDFAILELNGKLSKKMYKMFQYTVRYSCINGAENFETLEKVGNQIAVHFESRCFLSGWGEAMNEMVYPSLGIPEKSKYINVKIVNFKECQDGLYDDYLNTLNTEEDQNKVICARGYEDSTSCKGDSGGGLFCYDYDGKSVYLVGTLHGGADRCESGGLMYFANLAHNDYSKRIEKHRKRRNSRPTDTTTQ